MAPRFDGYIYLARSDASGLVKIGSSLYPKERIRTLRCADPTIVLIDSFPTIDMPFLEGMVHRHLRQHHVRGEWFDLSEDVLHEVIALLSQPPTKGVGLVVTRAALCDDFHKQCC